MSTTTIVIVDDQTLLRDSLRTILNLEPDFEVIGTAGDGEQAYRMISSLQPDIVLMDVEMPIMDGIECTKWVKRDFPHTKILILTTFAEDEYIIEALANGASGFLLKDIQGEKLLSSIRDAVSGQVMLPAVIAEKLARRLATSGPMVRESVNKDRLKQHGIILTERDKSIISLMVKGMSNQQIARTLFMTEGTVKNYVSTIYGKIGTNDRSKAILYLRELGFTD